MNDEHTGFPWTCPLCAPFVWGIMVLAVVLIAAILYLTRW